MVLDQFTGGPDDDSKESKHVVQKWYSIIKILLCFDGICISLLSYYITLHVVVTQKQQLP